MVKSNEIYNAINEVMNNGKNSIIEFFKAHNLTEMEFYPNMELDMEESELKKYEDTLSRCDVCALGHHRKWVELITLTNMELKQKGDIVEFYCYGEQECSEYEGQDVELLPESYAQILEFLEAVEPYIEYYK